MEIKEGWIDGEGAEAENPENTEMESSAMGWGVGLEENVYVKMKSSLTQ